MVGDLITQVDTISSGLMPQILQNVENMVTFISKFSVNVKNIDTGNMSFIPCDYPKEDTPSTSTQNIYQSKIITGEVDTCSMTSEDTNITETSSPCSSTPEKETGLNYFI